MKHINRIRTTNWQGRSVDQPLAPLTIITGDNMKGKTAITNALRVALIGYSPKHGKKAADTFGFAGARTGAASLGVGLEVSDGQAIHHTWTMKRGSVKYEGSNPLPTPPVLLDIRDYLQRSGPDKVRYVFQQLDLAALGFGLDKVTARLKKEVKVKSPNEASEAALGQLLDDIAALDEQRHDLGQTWQEWMELVLAKAKASRDECQAIVDSMSGTIVGTSQIPSSENKAPVVFDRQELDNARATLADLEAILKSLARDNEAAAKNKSERDRLEHLLATTTDPGPEIARLEGVCTEIDGQIAAFTTPLEKLLTDQVTANMQAGQYRREAEKFQREHDAAVAKLAKDLAHDACPFCHAEGGDWKVRVQKEADEQIEMMKGAVETNKVLAKQEADRSVELEAQIKAERERVKERDALQAKARTNRQTIAGLREAARQWAEASTKLGQMSRDNTSLDTKAPADRCVAQRAVVQTLEAQERAYIAQQSDLARAEEARQKRDIAEAGVEVCKLAIKSLEAEKAEIMDKAFSGFMAKANRFTDGIMAEPLAFKEGDIGYQFGATWVGLDYFSGTEDLLASAGLSVALAQQAPIKLVIMDELGRLAVGTKFKLLQRVREMLAAGEIDQFIGLDVSGNDYAIADGELLLAI
jgi:hypothetical protein